MASVFPLLLSDSLSSTLSAVLDSTYRFSLQHSANLASRTPVSSCTPPSLPRLRLCRHCTSAGATLVSTRVWRTTATGQSVCSGSCGLYWNTATSVCLHVSAAALHYNGRMKCWQKGPMKVQTFTMWSLMKTCAEKWTVWGWLCLLKHWPLLGSLDSPHFPDSNLLQGSS